LENSRYNRDLCALVSFAALVGHNTALYRMRPAEVSHSTDRAARLVHYTGRPDSRNANPGRLVPVGQLRARYFSLRSHDSPLGAVTD
jgi:hypothetical protein